MADLVVIVPSRGRPTAAAELVQTFNNTCTANTELVFAVDEDDPELLQYQNVIAGLTLRIPVLVGVTTPGNMVSALNQAAVAITKTQNPYAIGFMGDDHRPHTQGWDCAYLDALRELGTGVVYGNDLIQGANLPTQCAMTADIVATLGYMAPTSLHHMYVDNFWKDLASKADCLRYLPDVVVEHLHPVAGKVEWDDGHRRVNAPEVYSRDQTAYLAYVQSGRLDADVDKVRALQLNPVHEWRLFEEGTVPEYTQASWYDTREHAPHLEQREHRDRLMATATLVALAGFQYGLSKVVDLGAGDGGLLSLLGPGLQRWGYDLAPANVEAAKKRGSDVRYGNVLTDDIEWADIAVCTEMLEHLVDPHGFVATIAKHAKVLICSSPRLETGSNHYEFHTWAWDEEGYRNLLQNNGFKVKRQQRVGMFQVVLAVKA